MKRPCKSFDTPAYAALRQAKQGMFTGRSTAPAEV